MPYPFLAALADLDSSLQALEAQLDRLGAALPFDEYLLLEVFHGACLRASALAGLVHAERPQAQWDDRPALDSLLVQLELDAETRRREQYCARLVELAGELQAGQVKHRFESRTAALNKLREEAVQELQAQAAAPLHAKELPGPDAVEWLEWAFNLKDEEDAAVIARLREDFGALERFTAEMEDIYWLPAGRTREVVAGTTPQAGVASAGVSAPAVAPPPTVHPPPARTEDPVASTMAAAYAEHQHTATQASASGTSSRSEAAPRSQPPTTTLPRHDAAEANVSTVTNDASIAPPVAEPRHDEAPVAPRPPEAVDSAPAVLAEPKDTAERTAEGTPEEPDPFRKRLLVTWLSAGCFLALSALFFGVIYHLHGRNAGKQASTVQAATIGTAPATADAVPEPDPSLPNRPDGKPADIAAAAAAKPALPLLHKQPAEGVQDSIVLSLEQCDRGTPEHVECWGYVSNVGGANSRVSLDRVDVVDGRGNSFSLDRNGQFAFPSGRSSNVAPGDKVKFMVKVPDKDADARTLTLYMDLSNPRNLEYTFRDVPIAR